ncbi:hypothetical protein LMG9964_05573 [Paraburkholderia phenoliruptrix]|uniref:Uncharacterized protein n=1 Tax=Paraburkholderia phenoliruptrix TaxID=252970 RepID=A0A6J5KCD5_9BURK|nr:hypothetical protein LMG9964_05573 [Paraburkholderia phenoliruptrix]
MSVAATHHRVASGNTENVFYWPRGWGRVNDYPRVSDADAMVRKHFGYKLILEQLKKFIINIGGEIYGVIYKRQTISE